MRSQITTEVTDLKNEDAVRLFDQYSDDLFRFAVSYVGSKHDAEDIVQEVFLKILGKHIPIIKSTEKTYLPCSYGTFLFPFLNTYYS
ncbi:MAG: hypothetical protein E7386_03410 [Ruminococcaceae bacterium]|nr:hypothetical protein [Oscillospiraceae bacterium]